MYRSVILSVAGLLLYGCASAPQENISESTAQRLIGKSQADMLQCAGKPVRQTSHGQGLILRYYKEASMFEESRPFLKGSQPGVHHGCWASLLIENDRVTGVEFRTVPEGVEPQNDECLEIFQGC
ncbi:MAG: hypothetical protein A4E20_13945 [Nitrospira sp. SG-bin2]|uniref:hypothetical protein n=1 Tax=Nitrospira cf. moscoviensis SBR1015 TaxID=96242 RepID=UPI000A0A909B|nr:hypothetical protein [Nitrospira cf. moscoviensis SBR1015]OQW32357.1 MAG: hypothetical protein A4E20_13945 [Nitrospira sp. SG-bin2]